MFWRKCVCARCYLTSTGYLNLRTLHLRSFQNCQMSHCYEVAAVAAVDAVVVGAVVAAASHTPHNCQKRVDSEPMSCPENRNEPPSSTRQVVDNSSQTRRHCHHSKPVLR
jgi:hypothetical protein